MQAIASPQIGQNYKQGGSTPNIAVTVAQQVKSPTLISEIVNSASYAPSDQVAPCSWVAIFGQTWPTHKSWPRVCLWESDLETPRAF